MRTITQRTTLPFLIADSGEASFTAAVTTSPSPARSPRSPPRGAIQESLRAPLLSATSRIVLIPIMLESSTLFSKNALSKPLDLYVEVRRLRCAHKRGTPDHLAQTPPLQPA